MSNVTSDATVDSAPPARAVENTPSARQASKIPCPFLGAAFSLGLLKVDELGRVNTKDADAMLESLGFAKGLRDLLVNGGDKTDEIPGSFDLFALNGSSLDHTGSTGIRQDGLHPEKFDTLASFSSDGVRMTQRDFARAANAQNKLDPGFKGTATQTLEFSLALEVFGHEDDDGERVLTVSDARRLWVDGKFPVGWTAEPQDSITIPRILGRAAKMGFDRIID